MQKLIVFLLIAGFAGWWTASHHVVRTDKGALVLQKRFLTCADTYVDARGFTSEDFDQHPELKRAMIDGGYRDMLADLKTEELKAGLGRAMDKAQAAAEDVAAAIKKTVETWIGDAQGSGATTTNQPPPAP